jgi:cell wall-associated NlpC family hydrolase
MGYQLSLDNDPGPGLPRRAYAMATVGPGVLIIPNEGKPPKQFDRLQVGDLVFFNTAVGASRTDHSGIYMGLDDAGRHRFISSRAKADGPTLGDRGGDALLDGDGYWAVRFRAARRI